MIKAIIIFFLFSYLCPIPVNSCEDWDFLINRIAHVESRHNPNATNGKYVGLLQISPIMVREANRICGYEKYTYEDRKDSLKSTMIFKDVMNFHNPSKSLEKAVTIWNGKKNQKYINNMFKVKNCKRCTNR